MLALAQVATLTLVAIAFALALAHALEFPGKMRLSKEEYLAVQPIYHPGFTIGGVAEPAAIIMLAALLFLAPHRGLPNWLLAGALLLMLAMHAVYWMRTHAVNNFWLRDAKLTGAASTFFAFRGSSSPLGDADWIQLRDQWENSHLLRAALGLAAFILLAASIAI